MCVIFSAVRTNTCGFLSCKKSRANKPLVVLQEWGGPLPQGASYLRAIPSFKRGVVVSAVTTSGGQICGPKFWWLILHNMQQASGLGRSSCCSLRRHTHLLLLDGSQLSRRASVPSSASPSLYYTLTSLRRKGVARDSGGTSSALCGPRSDLRRRLLRRNLPDVTLAHSQARP